MEDDVVETSDIEEQEQLAATRPSYYEEVWGNKTQRPLNPATLNALDLVTVRTPQKRVQPSGLQDPSPQPSLSLSPASDDQGIHTVPSPLSNRKPKQLLSATPPNHDSQGPSNMPYPESPVRPSARQSAQRAPELHSISSPDPISFLPPITTSILRHPGHAEGGMKLGTRSPNTLSHCGTHGEHKLHLSSQSNSSSRSPHFPPSPTPYPESTSLRMSTDPLHDLTNDTWSRSLWGHDFEGQTEDTYRHSRIAPSPSLSGTLAFRPKPLSFSLWTRQLSSEFQGQEQNESRASSPLTPSPASPIDNQSINPELTLNRADEQPQLQPNEIPQDVDPSCRKYSLRNRSAKQLNPFQYDKRLYTRLLKSVPEAIVKDPNQGHHGRRDRYEEMEEDAGNFEPDAEDDEEEQWRLRQKRKEERQRRRERQKVVDARLREMGIVFLSDDDGDEIHGIAISDDQAKDSEKRGKKRKRESRPHRFPMQTPMDNERVVLNNEAIDSTSLALKTRPRPRPIFKKRSTPQPVSQLSREPGPEQPQLDHDLDDQGGLDNLADEEQLVPERISVAGSNRSSYEVQRRRLKRGIPSDSGDSVQILDENPEVREESQNEEDRSTSEDETARDKATRRRMKILKRMMPSVLSNKLLAQAEQREREKTSSHHRTRGNQSPARLGHGRKRIVNSNSSDPKRFEIRGDKSESEYDAQTQHEVIVIDGDQKDNGSIEEDIGQPLEESEDELDAVGIHTWLEPLTPEDELLSDAKGSSPRRRQERRNDEPRDGDLIDRMLQRTKRVGFHAKAAPHSRAKKKKDGTHHSITFGGKKPSHRSGHGRLKQAKLSFPTVRQQRGDRSTSGSPRPKGHTAKYPSSVDDDANFYYNLQEPILERKKKRSRIRGAPQNLHINQHRGQRIISGRPRRIIRIDIHDDNFHNALAPEEIVEQRSKSNGQRVTSQISRLHRGSKADSDDFAIAGELGPRPRIGKISLDSDMSLLPSGINLGLNGYLGKGRLYELLTFLKGDLVFIKPPSLVLPDLVITPDESIEQMSVSLASACDMLYDASAICLEDSEHSRTSRNNAETIMHTIRHVTTYRVLQDTKEKADIFITTISEQLHHLIGRIEQRLKLVSADGFSLDPQLFSLYWFALEVRIRIIYALKRSDKEIARAIIFSAEQDIVLLLCRLLEYGFERTVGELQKRKEGLESNTASHHIQVMECWISAFYVSSFIPLSSTETTPKSFSPFWKFIETALERQSNIMDAQLFQSERIWRTVFGLCSLSQFSAEGISTSTVRLEAYWPIIKKALQCIRLTADSKLDADKPISALHQRDAYVRLVTARCLLLSERWSWTLHEAEDVFRELCGIFRSRGFSNLLGEPNDFPLFIRGKDESKIYEYECADTAYSLFLKLTIRAAKEFNTDSAGRRQVAKLNRLLSLVVPVGSPSFTKENPPVDQALSMLYNRYSAIFVAIYVNPLDIRSRIQQACRYITFREADADSRTAAIRGMMHIAILLRHLDKPLDDILQWVSDMIGDLMTEYQQAGDSSQAREEVILMLQLIIGTLRSIILTPALKGTVNKPAKYPDIALLQVWMTRLISVPLGPFAKDHRTGDEMCKCIQAFLSARRSVIPTNSIVRLKRVSQEESQEDYGNLDLDLEDPTLLALLDNTDQTADESHVADQKASEILDTFSRASYACLYQHLSCNILRGGPYYEADAWLKTWIGLGDVLVRHKKREWRYYFQLAECAWKDITDLFRRVHVRQQLTLSSLCVDPTIYESHQTSVLTLWLEALVSPEVTIQSEYTALLFNVDGLRHALLRQMPCEPDEISGLFNLSKTQFLVLRLQFIRQILINLSTVLEINQEGCYLPFIQTLLCSLKSYTDALGNDSGQRKQDYAIFRSEICVYLRTHLILLQSTDVQTFLTWADTV